MSSRVFAAKALLLATCVYAPGCGSGDGAVKPGGKFPVVQDPSTAPDSSVMSDPPKSDPPKSDPPKSDPPKTTPPIKTDAGIVKPDPTTPIPDGGITDPDKPVIGGGACLNGITDFTKAGPFKFAPKTSGSVKFWVPEVPAGCKVPVVHMANGTGGTCSAYIKTHERLASHGFLATCYENTNTGAGTQGLMAFETALKMFPDLADMRFGSSGHSQGGQAAFTVMWLTQQKFGDKGIYAGLAMEPASGFGTQPSISWKQAYAKITAPMFMFSGTADILVSEGWVKQAYDALPKTTEAYWWSAIGATHVPTPDGETASISIPWYRWKLLGDKAACEAFKKMADGKAWEKKAAMNEQACQ